MTEELLADWSGKRVRWTLRSSTPWSDSTGQHLTLGFDGVAVADCWRARAKRMLETVGLRRAAARIVLQAQMEIVQHAVCPITGDLLDRDGHPRPDLFTPTSPRVAGIELQRTLGQGVEYYLLILRTDAGTAEMPSFDATVSWGWRSR